MIKVDKNLVEQITWEQDPDNFDQRLYSLAPTSHDNVVIVNPDYEWILDYVDLDSVNSDKCVVWAVDNLWLVKKFPPNWTVDRGWHLIHCELELDQVFEYNPDINFKNYNHDFSISIEDATAEHIWYLDPDYVPLDQRVWAVKSRVVGSVIKGTKDRGDITPLIELNLDFNHDVPFESYNITSRITIFDLNYELVWYLDPAYNDTDEKIWAIRFVPDLYHGSKDMGLVTPVFDLDQLEYNPDISKIEYDLKKIIAPYHYFSYNLIYYVDPMYANGQKDIWAFKFKPQNPLGDKHIDAYVRPDTNFDVVFISYNESNAEENWQKVLNIFPNAQRVDKVKGIFEAHKQAATLATTDMFYVVDGDAALLEDYRFDYKPTVFDYNVVHLWTSRNPVNDLEYGYGGVKLFPRKLLLDAKTWRVDLTTGLGQLKLINQVSNITAFNTDPFNTWRSAFREAAKLASSNDPDAEQRLSIWCSQGHDRLYGEYALHGATIGRDYGQTNQYDIDKLKLINNYEWMKNEFTKFYK